MAFDRPALARSFIPPIAVLAAIAIPRETLQRLLRGSAVFAAAHVLFVVLVSVLPMQLWRGNTLYDGFVMTVRADEVIAQLEPYAADYLFATELFVFGNAGLHCRPAVCRVRRRVID